MNLTLLQPWGALLLLALPWIWYQGRHGRRSAQLLRCSLVTALALALMQPVAIYSHLAQRQVLLLDQSASLSADAKALGLATLKQQLANAAESDQIDVVQLGGDADQLATLPLAAAQQHYLSSDRSDLPQAVDYALSLIPHGMRGRIAVISDGLSSDNHWQRVLAALQLRQVSLDWLALPAQASSPFIAKVDAPVVRIGEQQQLQVQLQGVMNTERDLVLQVVDAGNLMAQQSIAVDQLNESNGVDINLVLGAASRAAQMVQLQLRSGEQLLQQRQVLLAANPAYAVLYVGQAGAAQQLQQLLGQGFHVQQANLPLAEQTDFTQYQAVMLDDVASHQLPELMQKRLQAAVELGTGLFYSGAEQAFADGKLVEQPLASLLPVELSQQKEQREPGVSLAIVIDSSGSMKGQPMELAKQVARLAVKKLKPQDQVGIVEFYGTRQWAVPMQNVEQPKEIERAIGRMQAQGGSELFPAIQEAYFGLKSSRNRYRHILLITDAAVEEDNYQRLLRFIAQDQINVSAVMVGQSQGGEQRMAELANWGRGRFYAIPDEFNMVELNFHRPASEPQAVYQRGAFQLLDRQQQALPVQLHGYSHTQAKAASQVLYSEAKSGDPLVSRWRIGAGSVTALMFSPLGESTANWQQWPEYGQWLAKLLSQTVNTQAPMTLASQYDGQNLWVQLTNHRAADASGIEPTLSWQSELGGAWHNAKLTLRAANIYTADIGIDNAAPVMLQASLGGVELRAPVQSNSGRASEFDVPYQFAQALQQVVSATGGVRANADANVTLPADSAAQPTLVARALYPWLLLLALIIYFVEIVQRRWSRQRAVAAGSNA